MPYRRLLNKLRDNGVRGKVLAWIEDWLTDRRQKVGIKGSFSGWQPVTSGILQGLVLGPQFFTIYINDLKDGTEGMVAKFADDTTICRGTGNVEKVGRLQNVLDRLGEWAKKWQMEYNVGKSEVMHFGRKNRGEDYFLNG